MPYSGGEVEVSLYAGVIMIGEHLRYSTLCSNFADVLNCAKRSGKIEFKQYA